MNKKKVYKRIVLLVIFLVIATIIGGKVYKSNQIKQTIISEATSIGEEFG
ncbi:MAG: hypothetical protein GX995_05290, partial [Clostridiales bacterium]|nr:hypothetical protein [Clostridiales bacterium]